MRQLINRTGFNDAAHTDRFPIFYATLTHLRVWVSYNDKYDRLINSMYDTRYDIWTKERTGERYDLVFLFQDDDTGLVLDQCLTFDELGIEGTLHIARHYHTVSTQRKRIEAFLSLPRNNHALGSLVWHEFDEDAEAEVLEPLTPTLVKFADSSVVIPNRVVKLKNKQGRPKKVVNTLNQEIGQQRTPDPLNTPIIRYATDLEYFKSIDSGLVQAKAFELTQSNVQVTRTAVEEKIKHLLTVRWNGLQSSVQMDAKMYEQFQSMPKPVVDLTAPHHPGNDHTKTDSYWAKKFEARAALQDYLCNHVWQHIIVPQLDEYPF